MKKKKPSVRCAIWLRPGNVATGQGNMRLLTLIVRLDRPDVGRATVAATPSQHQVMRHIGNGSPVQLVRNDIEIVSRIMPEQGQLERLSSIRNCQRSAGSRGVLMIAD